jgi:hypothetical protein
VPLRNWYNFSPPGTENTRMMVPVSDAVARRVPSLLRAMQESGARCASTTFMFLRDKVSNISISPDIGGTNLDIGGAWAGRLSPGSSLAFGKGYAK